MHLQTYNTKHTLELVQASKKIGIFPSKVAGADAYCASVGLYFLLKSIIENMDNANEKTISLVHPGRLPDGCEGLLKREELVSNITERNLVVTIDYADTAASKVHYSTENDKLKLFIGPVDKTYDISRVKTAVEGFDFDLIFTVGVCTLEDLGSTYTELKTEFDRAKLVNLDNTDLNTRFGFIDLVDVSAGSLSKFVFNLAFASGISPDDKCAKALLTGMSFNQVKY